MRLCEVITTAVGPTGLRPIRGWKAWVGNVLIGEESAGVMRVTGNGISMRVTFWASATLADFDR
jgi:hypothetical protein